jgi:hypothetical protein
MSGGVAVGMVWSPRLALAAPESYILGTVSAPAYGGKDSQET